MKKSIVLSAVILIATTGCGTIQTVGAHTSDAQLSRNQTNSSSQSNGTSNSQISYLPKPGTYVYSLSNSGTWTDVITSTKAPALSNTWSSSFSNAIWVEDKELDSQSNQVTDAVTGENSNGTLEIVDGAYILELKYPLSKGEHWQEVLPNDNEYTETVLDTNATVVTPAGSFTNVVEYQREFTNGSRIQEYYAPNVGMIKLASQENGTSLTAILSSIKN